MEGYLTPVGRELTEAEVKEVVVWQAYHALAGAAFRRSIGHDDDRFPDNAAKRLAQVDRILADQPTAFAGTMS